MGIRLHYVNQLLAGTLTASSQQSALPASYVRDQLPSKVWRSREYYNVVEGVNDRIDFVYSGAKVAELTPGNYATPALYLAHVEAALASAGLPDAAVTRTEAVVSIASSAAFSLPWATGPNASRSAGRDLGYDTSADDASATSHVADGASYHSREWLKVNLGAAAAADLVAIRTHNLAASGSITVQGHTSDAWSAPDVEATLAGNPRILLAEIAEASKQWWRLLIDDVANPSAYSELGVWWGGTALEPSRSLGLDYSETPNELTQMVKADQGATYVDLKARGKRLQGEFQALPLADKLALDAMAETVKIGRDFFLTIEPAEAFPKTTWYGHLEAPMDFRLMSEAPWLWTSPFAFEEAMG